MVWKMGWAKRLSLRPQACTRLPLRSSASVVIGSLALITAMASEGCRSHENASSGEATSTTGAQAMTPPPSESASTATPAKLSDANIAALIDEANAGDSALAAAALPKLTTRAARHFANLMIGEHHALHVQGLQVEQKQGITPQLPDPDPFKPAVVGEQQAMASAPHGRAADSTYIAHEIAIHQAVIDWAGQPQNQPTDPAYGDYLHRAGPVLVKHLKEAQAAQKTLERGTS